MLPQGTVKDRWVDNIKIISQRLAGGHLLWVGIWSGGENIGQLGSVHRYIGYSWKITGTGSVGWPPEYFLVYLEFGKCGCAGFVELGPGLFSGVFMILKMWVYRVGGTGPRTIFRCIYDFENVGAPGLWDRPLVYFWAFWKCRCMGLWSQPWTIFRCIYDFENVGAPGLWDRPPVYFWALWKCRCMGLRGKFSGPAGCRFFMF